MNKTLKFGKNFTKLVANIYYKNVRYRLLPATLEIIITGKVRYWHHKSILHVACYDHRKYPMTAKVRKRFSIEEEFQGSHPSSTAFSIDQWIGLCGNRIRLPNDN